MRAPESNFSRIKWKSTSTCFFLEYKIGSLAKYPTFILSQYKIGMSWIISYNSCNIFWIHTNSPIPNVNARNSTLVDNMETTLCFPKLFEIREFPMQTQCSHEDLLLSVLDAQSVSVYTLRVRLGDLRNMKPYSIVPFKYCRSRLVNYVKAIIAIKEWRLDYVKIDKAYRLYS